MGSTQFTRQDALSLLEQDSIQKYLKNFRKIPQDALNLLSIIDKHDEDRLLYQDIFYQLKGEPFNKQILMLQSIQVQRCIASLLGLSICDALGASTQFLHYSKQGLSIIKDGFKDIVQAINCQLLEPRAGTVGIWTDDCSMALCIADSLILNKYKFEPRHQRYLYLLWFFNGLNNGGRKHSIGLGGNIKISMEEFMHNPTKYCAKQHQFNNGNGSLMRLAPIPIVFRHNIDQALDFSQSSSYTTHNGIQAAQCCRLLASILVNLYKRDKDKDGKETINETCMKFETTCKSVYALAKSQKESEELFDQQCEKYRKRFFNFNRSVEDRNWNWKSQDFDYSKTRFLDKPGYIGSYCMDALSMALHTIWKTKSFKEVALLNANLGGDCDTVGAIAGQIAGAIYGIDKDMFKLYTQMKDFQRGRFEIFLKGLKLARRK